MIVENPIAHKSPDENPGAGGAEFDLLLACCGSGKNDRILKLVSSTPDWDTVLRIAKHHRLIPQLYEGLRGARAEDILPPDFLQRLRKLYDANVRQTFRLTRDLVRVLRHFEARGIPVLPYKGPVLATILYGDFTQRQFADLDLLVHPSDVERSKAALIELGYTPGFSLTPVEEKKYLKAGNEYAFDATDARNVVELQWQILPRFYSIEFDIAGFFERSAEVDVSGYCARTLCAEDLLLVLCVHAAKHAWAELSLVADIAGVVQSQSINWGAVCDQAGQLGVRRIVGLNLKLAHILLGTALPPSILEEVERDAAVNSLTQKILPVLINSTQVDTESISYFRLMLEIRECWRDRVRFLWRLIVTPNMGEWSVVRLPARLFPLYQVVRICRLAGRFLGFLWLLMRRDRANSGDSGDAQASDLVKLKFSTHGNGARII